MAEHNQQFDTITDWVNNASSWLTRRGKDFQAICFDTKGRHCGNGGDFRRALDEGTFPVRWMWPDQVAKMAVWLPTMTDKQIAAIEHLVERTAPSDTRDTFTVPEGYTAERINGMATGWLIKHGTGELIHYSEVKS